MPSEQKSDVKSIFQLIDELREQEEKAGVSQLVNERNVETEVIVVGAKQSGKSSLVLSFMNKVDSPPKPTTALEYKYARFSPKEGGSQIIANVWELAGDTQLAQLLDVVLLPGKLAHSQLVIVADLSKPGEVVNTVNYWLDACRKRVDTCRSDLRKNEKGQAVLKHLDAKMVSDAAEVHPSGIPVLICANKWDEFAAMSQSSTDYLQVMAKTLRYLAHSNGASLVYTREKDKDPVRTVQTEYSKPIVVPAGLDSLAQIGAPPGFEGVSDRGRLNDAWTRTFQDLFPHSADQQRAEQREKKRHVVDSEAYAEEAVDALRAQKLKELSQRAARLKAEAAAAAAGVRDVGSALGLR